MGTIREMKEGETIDFPIERISSVRASANMVGMACRRKYKTTTRTGNGETIAVTRIS